VGLISRVSRLLHEVARQDVLSRFRALRAGDVCGKPSRWDPEDVVTVVDRLVEKRLEESLPALLPDSRVVGEEAVHERPELLTGLAGGSPTWLLDPIDGTKNFIRGSDGFGLMLALVRSSITLAAWILLPARQQLFVAERGRGATLNGQRLRLDADLAAASPRGILHTDCMPADLVARLRQASHGHYRTLPNTGAACVEYASLLQGDMDFMAHGNLEPWDHAPGALLLAEAGGRVEHLDRRPYRLARGQTVLLACRGDQTAATVRRWFDELGPRTAS
jgi:fructose-1,6-bisphosphatase/inositol monophosphatase family enzyme